nr:phorbol-12-myristate-13-acetate-induced protein 1 [Anser cygnoides]
MACATAPNSKFPMARRQTTDSSLCLCFAERDAVAECALELRRIGDKADLRQRILNLIAKLFCPKT